MNLYSPRLYLVALLCILTGCATAPAPSSPGGMFLLHQPHPASDMQTTAQDDAHERPVLVLPRISLASYLKRDGIIYQTGPNRIVEADNNSWAAPLTTQTTDGLFYALDQTLSHVDVRRPGLAAKPSYRLMVYIERFQGRYDGQAVISGNWRLFGHSNQLIGRGDFARTTPLRADGYPALVRALSRGWNTIKMNLVNAIDKLLGRVEQQPGQNRAARS